MQPIEVIMQTQMSVPDIFITKSQIYKKFVELEEDPAGITFIFGAGASAGYTSDTANHLTPPTVEHILDREKNTAVARLKEKGEHDGVFDEKDHIDDWLTSRQMDLESYLGSLFKKRAENEPFVLNFLEYLNDLCALVSKNFDTSQKNNYKRLARTMYTLRGNLPWHCLSFNYDTLLEKSILSCKKDDDRNFNSFPDYQLKNPSVIKIHGSRNFTFSYVEKTKTPKKTRKEIFKLMMDGSVDESSEQSFYRYSSEEDFSGYVGLSRSTEWVKYSDDEESVYSDIYHYPLTMVPIHNTTKFECPYFKEQLEEAKKRISESKLVVVIGYNLGDDVFREHIKGLDTTSKELILVGTNSPKGIINQNITHQSYKWASEIWEGKNIKIFDGNGFGEFVNAIAIAS